MNSAASATHVPASEQAARFVFSLAGANDAAPASIDLAAEWPAMLRFAIREQALFALRDHFRRNPSLVARPEWGQRLALLVLDAHRRMHTLRRRLEETLVALNEAGVEPLLLKGAAMAATIYNGWDRRAMRDIDIQVSSKELAVVRAQAVATGWVADPSLPGDEAYETHHHAAPLLDAHEKGLRFEVHRWLLPLGHPFAIEPDEILDESREVRIGETRARVMAPHHQALHVAIHFVWSHELGLGAWNAFHDLDALIRSGTIDWTALVRTSARWRARSCLYWALRLGRSLSGLAVPDAVLAELSPITSGLMLDRLERHFVASLLYPEKEKGLPVRLERTLWSVAVQPRQQGHGESRPWSVSEPLRLARAEMPNEQAATPTRKLAQLKQSVLYLSKLV